MAGHLNLPRSIFGLHEPGGEHLMDAAGRKGWIVFTQGIGRDPNDPTGFDHRPWSDRGFGVIARLNHGYGSAGTIPLPQFYDSFAERVRNFVRRSPGCQLWIIGNEMNHGQERPEGKPITPLQYAACYKRCWDRVHCLSGHDEDQVAVGAVAPWNNTTAYPGNETGDWVKYFVDILQAIRELDCPVDAIALHTHTHGSDPHLVFSEQRLRAPFQDRHFQFRCYRDFINAIPEDLRRVPIYITEADQDEPWDNVNRGWVQNAYKEINDWNLVPGNQQIRSLALYRWPRLDKWHIDGKDGIHEDFRMAMDHDYQWQDAPPYRSINDQIVKDPFLSFFELRGQDTCGLPISDEVTENGITSQYFQRLALQQDGSDRIQLKPVIAEIGELRRAARQSEERVKILRKQIGILQSRIKRLEAGEAPGDSEGGPERLQILQPAWENVVYELATHPTKRYETRSLDSIQHIVISHSAASSRFTAGHIAQFHVKKMGWPGIGYHFYVDGHARIFKTNELVTVSYHVGEWDPVSVGICVGGDFTKDIPTPVQLQSTAHLVTWLLQELGLSVDSVKGKQELVDTQSPGLQWLSGRRWKDILLTEIDRARVEKAHIQSSKPLSHYVLFWQHGDEWAEEDWRGAKVYIDRFRATHGFSAKDALRAQYVTIVGGPLGVSQRTERALLAAGCRVERIAGKNAAENARILSEMAYRGQRFLGFMASDISY